MTHGVLAAAAGVVLALQWRFVVDQRSAWLALELPVAAAALAYTWRRQGRLSLLAVLGLTLVLHLASILLFRHLGFNGDLDPNDDYLPEGHKLLGGAYPSSEYPVAAVLLFAVEAALEPNPPQVANAFLMLPFLLVCVWGIWSLHTRWSSWLAAVVGLWPLWQYYWQFRFDGAVAGLLVLGLLLARRGHWGWSGAALAAGACFKWTPGLSAVVLVAWLVSSRRFGDARRHVLAFLATVALFYVPCLIRWPAHDVLAAFRVQSGRLLTNESLWLWPARLLGLTSGFAAKPVWAPAGVPHWVDASVTVVQVLLLVGLVVAAVRRPGRRDAAVALAALAPVVFLVTNRVFSVQFVLVVAAGWVVAAALVAASRREQLLAGSAVAASAACNAFVYPFADPTGFFSWRPYALLSWIAMAGGTVAVLRWVLRDPAPVEQAEHDVPSLSVRQVGRVVVAASAAVAVLLLGVNLLIASTLPYGGWDSMYYGQWSRLIGLHGGFHFPEIVATHLHRPLFYVLQGELWRVAGFHQALGRLLSLAFAVLLVACLARLAAARWGRLGAAVATLVTLAVTDVEVHASDGLTDVPAAATIALVAVVVFTVRAGRRRTALLVLTALVALLTKPSGLVGCGALCLALLVGPLDALRRRLLADVAPICAGLALALVYDSTQARHVGLGLRSFLQSGVGSGIWADKSAAARPEALYGWMWLGRPLHVLLVFAVLYAVARVVGVPHRPAVLVAAPATWLWAWLGPVAAGHPFHTGWSATGLAAFGFALVLPLAALAPAEHVPSRLELARLLVWAVPSLAIWMEYAAYDTRLLSAAWPPLVLLLTAAVMAIVAGADRRRPALSLAPATVLVVAALAAVSVVNGFGSTGWREYRSAGWGGVASAAQMQNVAYGQLDDELAALRREVGPGERIYSQDGRLPFLFPGRVEYNYPKSCADLAGYRALVLLFSDETIAQAKLEGAPATVADWEACTRPRLTLVAEEPSTYAVLVVGKPRVRPPPAACGVPPVAGLFAVFGSASTEAGAEARQKAAAGYGFVQVRVVRTGCQRYLLLEPISDRQMGPGIVKEAKSVGIDVTIRSLGPAAP